MHYAYLRIFIELTDSILLLVLGNIFTLLASTKAGYIPNRVL